jgi:excisionase family DNA binding protein
MNTFNFDQGNIDLSYRLLKPMEVASLLKISRSFAYQLMQTGVIPVVRIGTACRVRQQDLETYIQKNIHSEAENL